MKIGENYFQREVDLGEYPIFSLELNRRVKNKEACVVAVVGEAGSSKSYTAIQLARNVDKRFGIDQIVFTYSEYCKELARNKPGIPIVFDEPSYAMGKREWYKEINQALVKTIESQRFLIRPLIIPIININLLDKTLRDYLVIFQVHMTGRGKALVYRMRASQGEDKLYRYTICRLDYPILDADKCKRERHAKPEDKNQSSCLDCKDLDNCETLRAAYERKKQAIQLARYEQDEEKAKTREAREFTDDQMLSMIEPYLKDCMDGERVIATKLRSIFYSKLGIKIGHNKAYALKSLLELKHTSENPS
jgi:ABC-type dipeptide/oligopeptide/nickel transport system ATPase component